MTEKNKPSAEELLKIDKIIKPVPRIPCLKPCYIHKYKVVENIGGRTNPFHWIVDTGGYPLVNIVFHFRGKPSKPFQVQIRHFHPGSAIGPTCCYVIESQSGTLGPAGFELVTFEGVRPHLPEVSILAVCYEEEEDFDVVAATIYATVA